MVSMCKQKYSTDSKEMKRSNQLLAHCLLLLLTHMAHLTPNVHTSIHFGKDIIIYWQHNARYAAYV